MFIKGKQLGRLGLTLLVDNSLTDFFPRNRSSWCTNPDSFAISTQADIKPYLGFVQAIFDCLNIHPFVV